MANPAVAADLVALFETRFDPARFADDEAGRKAREAVCDEISARVLDALDAVSSLDHDRIIRAFLAVVKATLRTNFYQPDAEGRPKPHVSPSSTPRRSPTCRRRARPTRSGSTAPGRGRAPALRRGRPRWTAVE